MAVVVMTAPYVNCDNDAIVIVSIIRPPRHTTYEDAANCYRPSSVICLSVGLLSVCHCSELCKNG